MYQQLLLIVALSSVLSLSRSSIVHRAAPCNFAENCDAHDFKRVQRAEANTLHTVKIHVRQNDFAAACPSLLKEVSQPGSPKYGAHLSFEELRKLTWDEEAITAVQKYLTAFDADGLTGSFVEVSPNGEYIVLKAPIQQIEKLFRAEFHHFYSESRNQRIVRANSYTIPTSLVPYITNINGIRNFPAYHKHSSIVGLASAPDGTVTPQLIWATYKLPNETDATPKADQAVFESLGQSYSPDDLTLFQQTFNLPIQGIKKVIGPNQPGDCVSNPDNCGEANLDVQYIMAMAQGAPTVYWSLPPQGDIFLDFIEEVAKTAKPPQVYSISYGGPEGEQNVEDMVLFNTEVCKMGLRGLTLFASSGDDGVAGSGARGNPSACGFTPQYPANCPYITTVGATMGPESGKAEVACSSNTGSIITTGGGFSNLFPQPTWQAKDVTHYLKIAPSLPPTTMFNVTGRAYPDIAALGNAYRVFIGGNQYVVSGTSASSPVFCAMVTLINGDRESNGKKPLGFINPLLYSAPSKIYNDITVGNNRCTAGQSNPTCCPYGFTCAVGWDPVTGRGSIDFARFAQYLADL